MLLSGSIKELCKRTRENPERHFPPHWDPPPKLSYGESLPALNWTSASILMNQPADWFWKRHIDKIGRTSSGFPFYQWLACSEEIDLVRHIQLLQAPEQFKPLSKSILPIVRQEPRKETRGESRREILLRIEKIYVSQGGELLSHEDSL